MKTPLLLGTPLWLLLLLSCAPLETPRTGDPALALDPSQGPYELGSQVIVTLTGEAGMEIRYTLDGTMPTRESPLYTAPFSLQLDALGEREVRAKGWSSGKEESSLVQRYITVVPSGYVVPNTLGALYHPSATTFRIWSPDNGDVTVLVEGKTHRLQKRSDFSGYTGVYEKVISGDLKLKPYSFRIGGTAVRDPYGKMVDPGTNQNIVMDMSSPSTFPGEGWAPRPSLAQREDSVIYEVHVRDFTVDSSWNGPEEKRGKFLGMVHPGTTTAGGRPTGLDHLKELGITHVQILPTYDFATAQYNWGYDPVNYNIPEEQYSASPRDYENRIREFRTMVDEFHKAGIRVVLDVVYNHTYGNEMFQGITGKYYTGNNDSGTGNGVNSGVPMVSRMIRDSLEYWIREFNVDGFRFDLIGIFHHAAVREWGDYLQSTFPDRTLLMYGEPWNGYWGDPAEGTKVRLGTTNLLASARIGVFNGKYREALKGNNDGTSKGYMFNGGTGEWFGAIPVGMRGSPKYTPEMQALPNLWDSMFALDPEQSINYISAHDNFCLWDKVYLSLSSGVSQNNSHQVLALTPPSSLEYPIQVAKFGMAMVVTSQGIPFLHGGDEFLRTKTRNENMQDPGSWNYGQHGGTHNSYNSPDSFNSFKWNRKDTYTEVFRFHRDLLGLRKDNPGLRLTTWSAIKSRMTTYANFGSGKMEDHLTHDGSLPGNVFLSHVDNDGDTSNGPELVVVYNSGNNFTVSLPSGTWKRVFDMGGAADSTVTSPATAGGTAVTVFKKQ